MNSLLTSMVNEVFNCTNRPDLATQTASAVKAATLRAHRVGGEYFYKDLVETQIVFGAASYFQTLDWRSTFPLWRTVKYLRKWDTTNLVPGKLMNLIVPEQVLDLYKISREDIFYVAGDNLQIRSSTQDTTFLLAYYANPNVTDAGYSSWVALDHPYAIVYDAALSIFKTIGYDAQFAAYTQMVADERQSLINSNIIGVGE